MIHPSSRGPTSQNERVWLRRSTGEVKAHTSGRVEVEGS